MADPFTWTRERLRCFRVIFALLCEKNLRKTLRFAQVFSRFLRFRGRFPTFCVFQVGPLQGRLHRCRYSALDAKTLRKLAMVSNDLWRGSYFMGE